MNAVEIVLSPDQQTAHDTIVKFWLDFNAEKDEKKRVYLIKLGGFAGTGKTTITDKTIMSILALETERKDERIRIAFLAFTGKAANVLRTKLSFLDGENDFCGTIHSLIYIPITKNGLIIGWKKADDVDYDLIVIDEASMVDEKIARDIFSFKKPVIAIGDHGQLPPISGDFNLMAKPDIRLEQIHRQAQDNPIIQVSMEVRKYFKLFPKQYGEGVCKREIKNLAEEIFKVITPKGGKIPLFLCAFNGTRVFINNCVRSALKIKAKEPIKGDRVICLKNNRDEGIYNGMTGNIVAIKSHDKDTYEVTIQFDGEKETWEGIISKFQFGQKQTPQRWDVHKLGNLFDFGYCLTVHKSQGSEAADVIVIEQRMPDYDDHLFSRWLYTAVTRARVTLEIWSERR